MESDYGVFCFLSLSLVCAVFWLLCFYLFYSFVCLSSCLLLYTYISHIIYTICSTTHPIPSHSRYLLFASVQLGFISSPLPFPSHSTHPMSPRLLAIAGFAIEYSFVPYDKSNLDVLPSFDGRSDISSVV